MGARVLIAGGGVAALEAAVALRELAGDRAEVAMYSPREDFVYRPFAVAEPYGASRADALRPGGARRALWRRLPPRDDRRGRRRGERVPTPMIAKSSPTTT